MWRVVRREETQLDDVIVQMSLDFYQEDPAPLPVPETHIRRTLEQMRLNPVRGKIAVLEIDGKIEGYSFLFSFWSNELGGEICIIDELYVKPSSRGLGHASDLIRRIREPKTGFANDPVAIDLEVTPLNARARALYERIGFRDAKNAHLRLRF